jgi:maltooligosyltrehalose trehalohydrolase
LVLKNGDARREVAMQKEAQGHYSHTEAAVAPGQQYVYRLDGGPERPDPCSMSQPDGVQGPSAVVISTEFPWTDQTWRGVRREDLVFYELHVGTFSAEGTFDGVIPRLADLKELGITAVEIMPVGQFPGGRNWGYDGVLPYAAQNTYGGPHGLQRLVDACHGAGLAIFLDVIYNHFGPEGNHLAEFGSYFTDQYTTPWGAAINYHGRDCDAVRDFVLDNVRMWLEEFHFDGLRLDAVHAIIDLGARHILKAIAEIAHDAGSRRGWPALVVAESDLNDPRLVYGPERGGHELDAQWADDFHHTVHSFLTGELEGYYADFGEASQLATAMERPFVYAWGYSPFRGRKHGAVPEGLPGDEFVVCVQNHDQVGNRARGDRLSSILNSPSKERLAASLLLLSPYVPLLFMGEEYGEEAPFPYFCSFHDPKLIEAVRAGRKKEFEAFAWQGEVPDPAAEATFAAAKLRWSWLEGTRHAGLRRLYRDLIAARRQWPPLRDFQQRSARLLPDEKAGPVLELIRGDEAAGDSIRALFNLSDRPQPIPESRAKRTNESQRAAGNARLESLTSEMPDSTVPLSGTRTLFSSEATGYGGSRDATSAPLTLYPFECIVIGSARSTASP